MSLSALARRLAPKHRTSNYCDYMLGCWHVIQKLKTIVCVRVRVCVRVCVCEGGHGDGNSRLDKIRVFRAEKSYAVTQGKWYFEFEAVTVGEMRVGWARPSVRADTDLGADDLA